ncbi:MAG: NAD(P)H-binding protein [Halobacteriaceae archaeon]
MNVLVTGATGFVGRALVPALLDAGHAVTAMTRDATTYDPPGDATVVEADVLDPDSLATAVDGIDVAYYLVHSLQSGPGFAEQDRIAATNFARAASDAGVDRVIYLGGLGETGDDLSEHLQSRRAVEAVLADGDYAVTTLRAAIIIGDGSTSFRMVEQLATRLPVMITPRWVRTRCQPIAIDDIVAYLVGVLDHPETAGETYEIGGPEVLTYEAMLRRTAHALGKHPVIIPVPVLSPELSVYWVDLVTDVPKQVAHPLIYGLKNPVVVTDDRIRDIIPMDLTPFDDAVRTAIDGTH